MLLNSDTYCEVYFYPKGDNPKWEPEYVKAREAAAASCCCLSANRIPKLGRVYGNPLMPGPLGTHTDTLAVQESKRLPFPWRRSTGPQDPRPRAPPSATTTACWRTKGGTPLTTATECSKHVCGAQHLPS